MSGKQLKSVSFSRWENFNECPYKAWLAYGERVPEPSDPDAPETPGERGNRIHEQLELFVKGKAPLPKEVDKGFLAPLEHLRLLFKNRPGAIVMEETWNFDVDWAPLPALRPGDDGWQRVWLRAKLDAFVRLSETEAVVVDFKTGKRWGKELAHESQAQIYAVSAVRRYPELRTVWTEFWYTSKDLLHCTEYRWPGSVRHYQHWSAALRRVTGATRFVPTPSRKACLYCPYKTGQMGQPQYKGLDGTGHCAGNLGVN